jgi:hypothetical protein
MLALALGQPAELHPPRLVKARGLVSQYYAWRKSPTVPYARYAGAWSRKPTPRDLVCAHRTLRFGTLLRITRGRGRVSFCIVLDRGPFGACVPAEHKGVKVPQCKAGYRYRVIVRRPMPAGGFYRGEIDATPAVHRLMGSKGWIWAKIERVGVAKSRRALRLPD